MWRRRSRHNRPIPTVDVISCDKQAVTTWSSAIIATLSGFNNLFTWGEGATSITGKLVTVKEMQVQVDALVAPGCMHVAQAHMVVALALTRKGLETILTGDYDAGNQLLVESSKEIGAVFSEIDRVKAERGLE